MWMTHEIKVLKTWEALMYKQESLPVLVLPKIWHTFWTLAAYSLLLGVLKSQALTSTLGLF